MDDPQIRTDQLQGAKQVLTLIDLTSLGDDDQAHTIDQLCQNAETTHGSVAAVCVWPRFVAQAADRMAGTGVGVAAVANFPGGSNNPAAVASEAQAIVEAGADEVDVVIPWRSLVAGESDVARRLVAATRAAVGDGVVLKAILETGELVEPDLIRQAAVEALDGGADFLKTSTGKTSRSATPEAVRLLLDVICARSVVADSAPGLKVSGGIRTLDQALNYLAIADEIMGSEWVGPNTFRIGASSLLNDVLSVLDDSNTQRLPNAEPGA